MSISQRKLNSFTTPVSSLPDDPTMSASALKAVFDSNAVNDIKPAFNGLIDDLCAPIAGVAGEDIHEQLSDVKRQLDEAAMGQVPDGSLTTVKLSDAAVTTEKLANGSVTREKLSPVALDHRLIPLESRVAKLEYEQYQFYLQSYYDGKNVPKKALFFDGFINSSMAETGSSMIDTTNKRLRSVTVANLVSQLTNAATTELGHLTSCALIGQGFVSTQNFTSQTLSVTVMLAKTGSPTDNVVCQIYSSTGNNPITPMHTSGTVVSGADLTANFTPVTFTFSNISLSATHYAIVIKRSGSINASNYYRLGRSTSDLYGGGNLYYYDSSSGAWSMYSNFDIYLNIDLIQNFGTVYQTAEQPLYSDCSKITLYLRRSLTSGAIIPEIALYNEVGSAAFQSMTKDTGYVSPVFPSSTDIEEKWDWEQTQTGKFAKLKLTFADPTDSEYVKAYGAIAGV